MKDRKEFQKEAVLVLRESFKIAEKEIGNNPSGDEDTRQSYVYTLGMSLFNKTMISFDDWRKIRRKIRRRKKK